MIRRGRCVVLLVASYVGCANSPPRLQRDEFRDAVVSVSGDAAAIRKLIGTGDVIDGGLAFADPACAAFDAPAAVPKDRADAFATCLASLKWQASTREAAFDRVTILNTIDGFEIEARLALEEGSTTPRLAWIGFAVRGDRDEWPTIAPETLEGLRTQPAAALPADFGEGDAWLKLCLDESGSSIATVLASSTPGAGRAFAAWTARWAFKPFQFAGHPIPACANVFLQSHEHQLEGPMVMPMARSRSKSGKDQLDVKVNQIEATRVSGTKGIVPDDDDKIRLGRGARRIGSFRLCLDETGHVEGVMMLRTTGISGYDQKIMRTMQTWVYRPYVDDGVPTPVCTLVTFIYSQR